MELKERKKVYKRATEKYGVKSQLIVALEEFAELSVEIAKHLNGKRANRHGLIDELADARITLEQVEFNLGLEEKVSDRLIIKMQKLINIVDNPNPVGMKIK